MAISVEQVFRREFGVAKDRPEKSRAKGFARMHRNRGYSSVPVP